MAKHAYLSASASHRWLACPPSAKLCAELEDQSSPYAQQGTDAHELCEYLVTKALGRDASARAPGITGTITSCQCCLCLLGVAFPTLCDPMDSLPSRLLCP